jgi:cytochrome c oxidase assembly factor CtaG
MKNLYSLALVAQSACLVLLIVHRFFEPMGPDLMFGVLIFSFLVGGYLLWQSLVNPIIKGPQKVIGIVMGFLPIVWVMALAFFIGNSKM